MWRLVFTAAALVAVAANSQRPSTSQTRRPTPEDKARFLAAFLDAVHWPDDAFHDADDRVRVQIIGEDPFAAALDQSLADRMVNGRHVLVTRAIGTSAAQPPHVAFIASTEEPTLTTLLATFCRAPVLTVSEIDGFANRGGIVGIVEGGVLDLLLDDHAVHFVFNRTAALEARLQLAPSMMHLAYPLFSAVSPCPRS
jgi:hypothetical protein